VLVGFSGYFLPSSGKNSDKIKKKKRKMNSLGIFEGRIINFVDRFQIHPCESAKKQDMKGDGSHKQHIHEI